METKWVCMFCTDCIVVQCIALVALHWSYYTGCIALVALHQDNSLVAVHCIALHEGNNLQSLPVILMHRASKQLPKQEQQLIKPHFAFFHIYSFTYLQQQKPLQMQISSKTRCSQLHSSTLGAKCPFPVIQRKLSETF